MTEHNTKIDQNYLIKLIVWRCQLMCEVQMKLTNDSIHPNPAALGVCSGRNVQLWNGGAEAVVCFKRLPSTWESSEDLYGIIKGNNFEFHPELEDL